MDKKHDLGNLASAHPVARPKAVHRLGEKLLQELAGWIDAVELEQVRAARSGGRRRPGRRSAGYCGEEKRRWRPSWTGRRQNRHDRDAAAVFARPDDRLVVEDAAGHDPRSDRTATVAAKMPSPG